MGYLTKDESPIPTFDQILQAHETLGALLTGHFNGMNQPAQQAPQPNMPNKLGIIAAPPSSNYGKSTR